ncbi:MAG: ABC transporter substrate-binding protein, partial [Candidatus Cloacimonetes bacterium]|nr:ABC transporter substrate-binding protein [Candidatus Cloacimonadota bacterium]
KQPDIAQVFESWTSKYIEADVLVDIGELVRQDKDMTDERIADIYPVFLESNTFNCRIMSFPFNKSVRAYFYNKDDFYRNGLDPNYFPKDWEEFRKYCAIFTKTRPGQSRPDSYGTNFNVNEWQFINMLFQAGGEVIDEQGVPALNSEQGVEALTYLTDLINKDQTVYTVQGYDGQNDFLAGKVAMYEGSSVSITHMRQQPINFNLGFAPLPTYRSSKSAVSGANIVIFKSGNSKKEKAAYEFIKWFTDTEQTAKWSALTFYMPIRKSAMQSPILKEFLAEYPQFAAIFQQLETAGFEPQNPAWFNSRRTLKNAIEDAFSKTKTPRQALDEAAAGFAKLLAEEG